MACNVLELGFEPQFLCHQGTILLHNNNYYPLPI